MTNRMSCGEATIRLLGRYGVRQVFGIPGVHTLDFCRGLDTGEVRHIQARNEQGAGFMAEGYARATGEPGVALVISGPGVTNAATAVGQAWADSLPLLLLSAEASSETIAKGWGVLHEITEQKEVTRPLTALSATAHSPQDVPQLMAQAFSIFAGERPRPVHISIPIDVLAQEVTDHWKPVPLPARPGPAAGLVEEAADMLRAAAQPVIMVGGGAAGAGTGLVGIAESLGAAVIASTAGKGIVPDDHPLSLSGSTVREETRRFLARADVVLAVGTELSETDSFVERLDINGRLIRIDIDAAKMNDLYPADLAMISDAAPVVDQLAPQLVGHDGAALRRSTETAVRRIRSETMANLTASERQHVRLLECLRSATPRDTVFAGDACQLVYTGAFAFPVFAPRQWFYPAGYCALGCALPNAIGALHVAGNRPVVALAGDGGFMFTMPELMVARDHGLGLPVIVWENGGLKQIQDDLDSRGIHRVGVEGSNPDFVMLARACQARGVRPDSLDEFADTVIQALGASGPTIIVVEEGSPWLLGGDS